MEREKTVARQLAEDLVDYLREHPDVCADVSPVDAPYVRHADGEWQRANREDYGHIAGGTYDSEHEVVRLFTDRPVTLGSCAGTSTRGPDDRSIWEDADKQDVFTDLDRCTWCGHSEANREVALYQTTEDGLVRLCESCRPTWEKDGQIVTRVSG